MGERIEAIIDALRSTPEDAFGCVPDTPDRQGWWIRDELIDSACKVREEVERLDVCVQLPDFGHVPPFVDEDTRQVWQRMWTLKLDLEAAIAEAQEDGDG